MLLQAAGSLKLKRSVIIFQMLQPYERTYQLITAKLIASLITQSSSVVLFCRISGP
jgi:hypothetical protein